MTRAFAIQLCVLSLLLSSSPQSAATGTENSQVEEDLERAARSFRLQIYATFRANRGEYDLRAQQAQQILEDWRLRGSPDFEVPRLLDWFRDATRASERSPLPSLPEYRPLGEPGPVTRIPPSAAPAIPAESPVFPIPETKPLQRQTDAAQSVPQALPLPSLDRVQALPAAETPKVVDTPVLPPQDPEPPQRMTMSASSPVDLAVLGSRIRSFNLTLAEIESELSQPGPWPVDRLTNMIDQIERLFGRRHLSQIYYDALTTQERQRVQNFASVDLTLALLDQRLFEAQVALMDTNFALDPLYGERELNQLRSLSEKVKNWTVLHD